MSLTKKQKQFLGYLEKSLGIVTTAAKAYGIDPSTHYKWMKNSDEYTEAVERVRDTADDFVESKLMQLVDKGDPAATIFCAKTRLKKRGYTEKTDVDITTGGKPLDTKFVVEVINRAEDVDREEVGQ